MKKTIINNQGYVTQLCVDYIKDEPQFYILKEDEQAVELLNKTQNINGNSVFYLKPRFINGVWIETATEEELNEKYFKLKYEPTEQQVLNAKLLQDNANMQIELEEQKKLNAQMLLQLASLGGNTNV